MIARRIRTSDVEAGVGQTVEAHRLRRVVAIRLRGRPVQIDRFGHSACRILFLNALDDDSVCTPVLPELRIQIGRLGGMMQAFSSAALRLRNRLPDALRFLALDADSIDDDSRCRPSAARKSDVKLFRSPM